MCSTSVKSFCTAPPAVLLIAVVATVWTLASLSFTVCGVSWTPHNPVSPFLISSPTGSQWDRYTSQLPMISSAATFLLTVIRLHMFCSTSATVSAHGHRRQVWMEWHLLFLAPLPCQLLLHGLPCSPGREGMSRKARRDKENPSVFCSWLVPLPPRAPSSIAAKHHISSPGSHFTAENLSDPFDTHN